MFDKKTKEYMMFFNIAKFSECYSFSEDFSISTDFVKCPDSYNHHEIS